MAHAWISVRGARVHNLKEHRRRPPAPQAGGHHRLVRLGQVVARLRHDLYAEGQRRYVGGNAVTTFFLPKQNAAGTVSRRLHHPLARARSRSRRRVSGEFDFDLADRAWFLGLCSWSVLAPLSVVRGPGTPSTGRTRNQEPRAPHDVYTDTENTIVPGGDAEGSCVLDEIPAVF